MPIGAFARNTGLTPSALRFYADCGLLPPAEVDAVSGYRYYLPEQVPQAELLRQLREIAMPLASVREVLDATPDEASRLIDEHAAQVVDEARTTRQRADRIAASMTKAPGMAIATLKGPILATALEQVLTATTHEPTMPVLGGVHIEARPDAITLIATDRYRLTIRSLVPDEPTLEHWSATVDGNDLRAAVSTVRRSASVQIESSTYGLRLRTSEVADQHCTILSAQFPDYQAMLDALAETTTRVTVAKNQLVQVLEEHARERLTLIVSDGNLHVCADDSQRSFLLSAAVDGDDLAVSFELTTLYPALSTAIGPDVMLDLRGPGQPVTVRSADLGDLRSVIMPIKPDRPS